VYRNAHGLQVPRLWPSEPTVGMAAVPSSGVGTMSARRRVGACVGGGPTDGRSMSVLKIGAAAGGGATDSKLVPVLKTGASTGSDQMGAVCICSAGAVLKTGASNGGGKMGALCVVTTGASAGAGETWRSICMQRVGV